MRTRLQCWCARRDGQRARAGAFRPVIWTAILPPAPATASLDCGWVWRMHSTSRGLRTRLCDALGGRDHCSPPRRWPFWAPTSISPPSGSANKLLSWVFTSAVRKTWGTPREAVTRDATHWLPAGESAVHIDVDVIDFTDAPLSENTDGRNSCTNRGCSPSASKIRHAARAHPRLFLGSSLVLLESFRPLNFDTWR